MASLASVEEYVSVTSFSQSSRVSYLVVETQVAVEQVVLTMVEVFDGWTVTYASLVGQYVYISVVSITATERLSESRADGRCWSQRRFG
jgi:hypothetical protein